MKTTFIQTTSNCPPQVNDDNVIVETIYLPGSGKSLSVFAEELAEKLNSAAAPIFVRDEIVMEVSPKGKMSPIQPEAFVTWIEEYVHVQKMQGSGSNRIPELASITQSSANVVLWSPQFIRSLRKIRRLNQVRQPVIRSNGNLELLPTGYDPEFKTWTNANLEFDQDMPLDESLQILENVLREFPWPKQDSLHAKSIAVTAMVSIFGDMLLPANHQRPVWIFNANREGSGKTTLMKLAVCPSFGSAVTAPPPNANSPDALSKLLASAALGAVPYLCFDNWKGVIGNSALEAFITSSTYSDRVLGVSKMFSVEKECIVLITGNNARVSPDMRRRSLLIDLEMVEARPEDRVIENPLGEPEILALRPKILAALWAIIREWDKAGRPEGKHRHPSFAKWGHLFGGMIENIGHQNPLMPRAKGADDTYNDFKIMIEQLLEGSTEREIGACEMREYCRENGLFSWVIDPELQKDDRDYSSVDRSERNKFGKICARFDGSRFGDIDFKKGEETREGKSRSRKRNFIIRRVTMS